MKVRIILLIIATLISLFTFINNINFNNYKKKELNYITEQFANNIENDLLKVVDIFKTTNIRFIEINNNINYYDINNNLLNYNNSNIEKILNYYYIKEVFYKIDNS
jgi:hypothetical protein